MHYCSSIAVGPTDPSSALEVHRSTFSWSPASQGDTESHLPTGSLQLFIQDLAVAKVSKAEQLFRKMLQPRSTT